MNEKEFLASHDDVIETLRAARGDCPVSNDLLDWAEGKLEGAPAEAIERHVTLCSLCAGVVESAKQPDAQVDDLTWQRTARRLDARRAIWSPSRPRLRPVWVAAAATVAAVTVILVYLPDEQALSPAGVAETRDADITLLEPRGPVRSVEVFRWQGIPAPVQYRIEVNAVGGTSELPTPLWSGVTSETRVRADKELLTALDMEQSLQWRVVVLDDEGHVLGRSEWVAFELAP